MNQSHSTSINYAGASSKPVSPCSSAYDNLSTAQNDVDDALATLRLRLGDALRDPLPKADEARLTAAREPAQSELHGMFLAALERTEKQLAQVKDLIDRLTV